MINIGNLIKFHYPSARFDIDYLVVAQPDGEHITYWSVETLGPQPTPEQLAAWEAEPGFQAWLAEHGGDAALTLRRMAKEWFSNTTQGPSATDRAIVLAALDEINAIRQWITSFKAAVAAATSLANFQTRVAALADMPDRTGAQLRTAIKAKLTAGDADA